MRSFVAAAAVLLLAFAARAADTAAPVVAHTPVKSITAGARFVQVFARITDESKFYPQVFYRYAPGDYAKPVDMKPVKGQKDQFGGNVPVQGPYVEYYLEAYDEFGNGPGRAGDPDHPFRVDTGGEVAQAEPAPARAQPAPLRLAPKPTPVAQAPSGGRTWTWIVGGVGLGSLAGGLLAGAAVKTADNAYNARLHDTPNNPVTLQSQYDANQSLGTKATILTIAGAGLLATSVALFFLEGPSSDASGNNNSARPTPKGKSKDEGGSGLQGSLVPLSGGAALALQGTF